MKQRVLDKLPFPKHLNHFQQHCCFSCMLSLLYSMQCSSLSIVLCLLKQTSLHISFPNPSAFPIPIEACLYYSLVFVRAGAKESSLPEIFINDSRSKIVTPLPWTISRHGSIQHRQRRFCIAVLSQQVQITASPTPTPTSLSLSTATASRSGFLA